MSSSPDRPRAASALALSLAALLLALPAPALGQAAPFTLVALPDTQRYTCVDGDLCSADEEIFDAQTAWIVANREALDIRYVAGLGDCVQDGEETDQYAIADAAIDRLEAAATPADPDGIPYGLAVGNRDQDPSGDPGSIPDVTSIFHPDQGLTTVNFNEWFGVDRFCPDAVCRGYYGDHFGINNDNHYGLFEANGYAFVVVYVEFMEFDSDLRQAVLDWTDDVLARHPDRRAIVVSHFVMKTGTGGPFSDQGEALYERLKHHPNLFLILGGHINGEGRRTDEYQGNVVHTVLSDYQGRDFGGEGWLRLLEFRPADDEIRVRTYSPWLDEFETDSSSEFVLPYDMNGGQPDAGCASDAACDDGSACTTDTCDAGVCRSEATWPDLEPDGVCNPALDETPVVRGQPTTLTLTNAAPGSQATFLVSTVGDDGPEMCAPTAPVCTTLQRPLIIGTAPVDPLGVASLQITVPATLPAGRVLYFQAAWIDAGAGQVSEIDALLLP